MSYEVLLVVDFDDRSATALDYVRVRLNVLVREASDDSRTASALLSAYYTHKYTPDKYNLAVLEAAINRHEGTIR